MNKDLFEVLDGIYSAINDYNAEKEAEAENEFCKLKEKFGVLGLRHAVEFADFVRGRGKYENCSNSVWALEDAEGLLESGDKELIASILDKCNDVDFECVPIENRQIIKLIHTAFYVGYGFRRIEERKED
jgi:hypothetical protein